MQPPTLAPQPHSLVEDAQAIIAGTLLMALAVMFFRQAGLLTGGTAGLAFLIHYLAGWSFGAAFFILNLPFYVFAVRSLGWTFTFKTFAAVAMLSAFSEILPRLIHIDRLDPLFAAIMGGLLAGVGLLILIRHKASLGGVGVLAIHLQNTRGWSAGKFQMGVDCAILIAGIMVVDPLRVVISVLGGVALNLVIAVNHKPGRYVGF